MADADSSGRIHVILESLIREQRRLEHGVHEDSLIEANTKAIAYWHRQLEERRSVAVRSRVVRVPADKDSLEPPRSPVREKPAFRF